MPQASRYSDEQIETLLNELSAVLAKHHTPTDLSLMVLGNMITHVINTSVSPEQRKTLARSFSEALLSSIREPDTH
ncbi:YejL family protein [Sodalis ligni]|jgi:uncharacterized protein YejL (UPF0352 family)|uniref:UPF0352 protein EZJ58_5582 n=1 Tax=Sodalis ligni TaxID=2697027 RepID=A0A4R1NJF0_9GAMM|nr:YejL family protein [Sodalis ligni]QWA09413.1 YejL family protein [Sodalis ligni]TCL07267.1 hypothetical protein EZJ58_5582 [Sodalis ligni]